MIRKRQAPAALLKLAAYRVLAGVWLSVVPRLVHGDIHEDQHGARDVA